MAENLATPPAVRPLLVNEDGELRHQVQDELGSAAVIEHEHWMSHRGRSFELCQNFSGLDSDDNFDVMILTAADCNIHIVFDVSVKLEAELYFIEVTTTGNGTDITSKIFNKVMYSSVATTAQAFHTPTGITENVVKVNGRYLPASRHAGAFVRGRSEWECSSSSKYIVRVKSLAANNRGSIDINYYHGVNGVG